jgi:hypothetical protein
MYYCGSQRMYVAVVDFPGETYKHDLYETTSDDGIHGSKPTFVMAARTMRTSSFS